MMWIILSNLHETALICSATNKIPAVQNPCILHGDIEVNIYIYMQTSLCEQVLYLYKHVVNYFENDITQT